MTGRIGITCAPKSDNNFNKDLYFKKIEALEVTHNSIKLNYLLNIDDSNRDKLNIMVEVNGETYNNITVDKINRTVTINNLNPETDYNINLIASFEPYVERSKTIKHRTLYAPPSTLVKGSDISRIIIEQYNNRISKVVFEKGIPQNIHEKNPIDVSEKQDKSILSFEENEIMHVVSNGKIFANKDSSCMFFYFDGDRYTSWLNSIEFKNFDTSNVTDMSRMFGDDYPMNIIEIKGIELFDTSKVTNMACMFNGCNKITSLNISNWNTNNVTDMSRMFMGCTSLTALNINNWNTNNVINMNHMFDSCSSLTNIDISNFNTSQVTDMEDIFGYCSSLISIKGLENFDTNNVTNMSYMFGSCNKLSGSITIMNPHTGNYGSMFTNCSTDPSSKFYVNYTGDFTKEIAKKMVATKSSNSNVVLGTLQ